MSVRYSATKIQNAFNQLGKTTGPMNVYVDSTGSDVTGDGTAALPYATITKAHSMVPYTIQHAVHIHIAAGAYDLPVPFEHRLEGDGLISLDGSSAMADVDAGPYTVGAGGPVAISPTNNCFDIPVSGGGLTPSAWAGKLILWLTGTLAGGIEAIVDNTATEIKTVTGYSPCAAGNTFKIVEPGVEITIPAATTENQIRVTGWEDDHMLAMPGVKLTATTDLNIDCGYLLAPGSIFDCEKLDLQNTVIQGFYFGRGTDADYVDEVAFIDNYNGAWVLLRNGTGTASVFDKGGIRTGACFRPIDMSGGREACFVGACVAIDDSCINVHGACTKVVVDGYLKAKATKPAIRAQYSHVNIEGVYVEQGSVALETEPLVTAKITALDGNDATVTNALKIGNGSRVAIGVSEMALTGAGGAGHEIVWASGAADSAPPAANNVVTDSLGAQVVGY